jgi:hypothetical protein
LGVFLDRGIRPNARIQEKYWEDSAQVLNPLSHCCALLGFHRILNGGIKIFFWPILSNVQP